MMFTDMHAPYAVRLDYSHNTAEIIRMDGAHETSVAFMQGDEADSFLREDERIPDSFMVAFLSDYDYAAEREG